MGSRHGRPELQPDHSPRSFGTRTVILSPALAAESLVTRGVPRWLVAQLDLVDVNFPALRPAEEVGEGTEGVELLLPRLVLRLIGGHLCR